MKHLKTYNEEFNLRNLFYNIPICKKYNITNYTINEDRSIDVKGDVLLAKRNLTKLPLRFRNVSGCFFINNNQLTTLFGSPVTVGDHFYCQNNKIKSFKYSPQSIGGDFRCYNNQILSFEGFPKHIGEIFCCSGGLSGRPGNPIQEIWKLLKGDQPFPLPLERELSFQDSKNIELFNDYDIIRGDTIILDRLNDFLTEIGMGEVQKSDILQLKKVGYKCI